MCWPRLWTELRKPLIRRSESACGAPENKAAIRRIQGASNVMCITLVGLNG